MSSRYDAADIEVLSGLDPVRRRPGMYTDTTRPNHLAQEVVDNAVDEALAGHAREIEVTLYRDGSCEVSDDGRGMPVDMHPEEKIPGVELILTRLHAGGKFSGKNYTFSGGLHGVGVSVVNALSSKVEVGIKRDGNEYRMEFRDGFRSSALDFLVSSPCCLALAAAASARARRSARFSASVRSSCCVLLAVALSVVVLLPDCAKAAEVARAAARPTRIRM